MRTVQLGPLGLPVTCLLMLAALGSAGTLDAVGWLAGLLCGAAASGLLWRARSRHHVVRLGPADVVTLLRAALACGVAGLTLDTLAGDPATRALVGLAAVALALDWVDGQVARRTGTASAFGAALDMEVDAFLVLVLSVEVAASTGAWVLLIGAARYLLLLGGRWQPWLLAPMPTRYWAKVVAATQGVVLTVAAAGALPGQVADAAVLGALAALAVSFGHQVWWLRSHPHAGTAAVAHPWAQRSMAA